MLQRRQRAPFAGAVEHGHTQRCTTAGQQLVLSQQPQIVRRCLHLVVVPVQPANDQHRGSRREKYRTTVVLAKLAAPVLFHLDVPYRSLNESFGSLRRRQSLHGLVAFLGFLHRHSAQSRRLAVTLDRLRVLRR